MMSEAQALQYLLLSSVHKTDAMETVDAVINALAKKVCYNLSACWEIVSAIPEFYPRRMLIGSTSHFPTLRVERLTKNLVVTQNVFFPRLSFQSNRAVWDGIGVLRGM